MVYQKKWLKTKIQDSRRDFKIKFSLNSDEMMKSIPLILQRKILEIP